MEKREKGRGHDKNLPVYRSAAIKRMVMSCFTSHPKDGKQEICNQKNLGLALL